MVPRKKLYLDWISLNRVKIFKGFYCPDERHKSKKEELVISKIQDESNPKNTVPPDCIHVP